MAPDIMVKDHSDSERGNLLPPHGLLFLISSKCSFICIITQTGLHIPQPVLYQTWSTGWNKKWLNGFTMNDRSDDPSHHERTLLPRSYSLLRADRVGFCCCCWVCMYYVYMYVLMYDYIYVLFVCRG